MSGSIEMLQREFEDDQRERAENQKEIAKKKQEQHTIELDLQALIRKTNEIDAKMRMAKSKIDDFKKNVDKAIDKNKQTGSKPGHSSFKF